MATRTPPRVSFVVPVYNGARTLSPALRSLCDQTHDAHQVPVLPPSALQAGVPSGFMLVAVARFEARRQIREYLETIGLVELTDYVCVA